MVPQRPHGTEISVAPNLADLNIAIPSFSEPTQLLKFTKALRKLRLGSDTCGEANKVHDNKYGNVYAVKYLRAGSKKEKSEEEIRLLKSMKPNVSRIPSSSTSRFLSSKGF